MQTEYAAAILIYINYVFAAVAQLQSPLEFNVAARSLSVWFLELYVHLVTPGETQHTRDPMFIYPESRSSLLCSTV